MKNFWQKKVLLASHGDAKTEEFSTLFSEKSN